MKAVLQSIKPQYCELIAAGKKTIEVRKTKPNIPTPFKVYIYCTKGEKLWKKGNSVFLDKRYNRLLQTFDYMLNGKIIGEYVCDEIQKISAHNLVAIYFNNPIKETCITDLEMLSYANGKPLYLWHISNLVIYDKPKELSEFRIIDKEYLTKCPYRSRIYNNPDYTNGALLKGSFVCVDDGEPEFLTKEQAETKLKELNNEH